jgi:molybdopterin synthase catalytic subunit
MDCSCWPKSWTMSWINWRAEIMANEVKLARLSSEPILLEHSITAVSADDVGAVVSFSGIVRDHDHGRTVTQLEYEAHPSAEALLRSAAETVAAEHPGVRIAVEHRTGSLAVGDLALACAVSSAHRADSFVACARLVGEVKLRVPIWKRQHFADGTTEWVGGE